MSRSLGPSLPESLMMTPRSSRQDGIPRNHQFAGNVVARPNVDRAISLPEEATKCVRIISPAVADESGPGTVDILRCSEVELRGKPDISVSPLE